jgi:hypothetical protein
MADLTSYELPTVSGDQLDPKGRQAVGLGVVLGEGDDPVRGVIWLTPEQTTGLIKALLAAASRLGEPVRLIDVQHLLVDGE